MALKLYNTFSRNTEELVPGGVKKENISDYPPVTIYSCGPTVYNFAHIGNFRTFIFNDILRRYLKFRGYKVDHAMNITDVDDKTIKGSIEKKVSLKEFTQEYTKYFLEDIDALNIERPEKMPRATDSIGAMEEIIEKLDKNGLTYEKEGSVYYAIKKFKDYGKLAKLDMEGMKTGTRYDTDEYSKDDLRDFVLWKAPKDGEPSWDIKYGKGRPGWHIECSAMIRQVFGGTIDIHTGGIDLVFPHHENEIAQSEGAYGDKFVRYWIHAEFLLVNGTKMSKSLGNFYTLRDLIGMGHSPRAIRYVLLSAHYRKQLNFTLENVTAANQPLTRIDNFVTCVNACGKNAGLSQEVTAAGEKLLKEFTEEMDNDLNMSGALGHLFDFIHALNPKASAGELGCEDRDIIISTLEKIDMVLGVIFQKKKDSGVDAERIEKLIEERKNAKLNKDFKRADEIRDSLLKEGIVLEDTKGSTRWKKA